MPLFYQIRKTILFFFILIFLSFNFSKLSYSNSILFQDNFSSVDTLPNPDNWRVDLGNWFIAENSYLKSTTPTTNTNAYLFYRNGVDWQNYSIRLKIKSENGVDQSIGFRVQDTGNFYFVTFRYFQDVHGGNVNLNTKINNQITLLASHAFTSESDLMLNNWYNIKIEIVDFRIKIYLEGELLIDFEDISKKFSSGGIMFSTWTGVIKNLSMSFDELSVTSISPAPAPAPTPTPTPPPPPTLLLPGLGGCWSRDGILLGKESDNWNLGPGVFIYENLRDTLTRNDYAEGKNFDIFCYDWRKEIDKPNLPDNEVEGKYLVSDFKQKIDNFYTKNNHQKINLIGHSMGGLIIRAYAQRYGMEKINKIVTAGSPHYGTIKAYEVWEGALIIDPDRFNLADFFMQMLLTANRLKYSTVIETIRNIAPSGENFLPTFVYMKSKRNPELTLLPENLIQKNNFLLALNSQNFDNVKQAMTTIAGIEEDENYNTLRWLLINDINWYSNKNYLDVISGKWEDMKPDGREYSLDGDLHILKLSSLIDGTNQIVVPGTHDSMMYNPEGLQAILDGLDLGYEPVINPPPFLFRVPFIAAIVHSPADIKIVGPGLEVGFNSVGCSNCYYNRDEGLIFISDAPKGDYQIELTSKDGGGNYRLDFGQITKEGEKWNSINDRIDNDQVVYPIKFDPQNIQTVAFSSENGEELLKIAKNELLSLNDEFEAISSHRVKRKIKRYNDKSLSYLESAIKYLSKGKFKKSSTYIIRSLSQIYRTRLLINKYYLQNKIDYTTRSLVANKLMNTAEILNHGYVIARQKSSGINSRTAQRHLNSSKRLLQGLESRFASYNQTNYLLGSIIEKTKEFLSIAEEKFNEGNFESSYIHSFGARWLILEAMRIGWSGWF